MAAAWACGLVQSFLTLRIVRPLQFEKSFLPIDDLTRLHKTEQKNIAGRLVCAVQMLR